MELLLKTKDLAEDECVLEEESMDISLDKEGKSKKKK